MPPAYSNDLKWRIIYLQYDGYSKEQISKILYVSMSLVNKVLCLYKKWGTVTNPWRQIPGRHKTFNQNDMNVSVNKLLTYIHNFILIYNKFYKQILRNIVQENVDLYLDEIVWEMEVRSGKRVSVPTLWRSLTYCRITRKKVYILYILNSHEIIIMFSYDYLFLAAKNSKRAK